MKRQEIEQRTDPLLLPFLAASDEAEARELLAQLITHITPTIKRVISCSRQPEDDYQEAVQHLIKYLWRCRAEAQQMASADFLHYAAVVATHICRQRLRQEHPQRQRLKDALRHLLRQDQRFALWTSVGGESLCGLAAWRGQAVGVSERLSALLNQPRAADEALLPGQDAQALDRAELARMIFNWVGHPLRFNDLVSVIFALQRLEEHAPVMEDEAERAWDDTSANETHIPDEPEWREFLTRVWAEIEQLPPRQRSAYLLNFTAADGAIELFQIYGVAGVRRIGAALQLSEEQFARAWPELKLDEARRAHVATLTSYDEKFACLWQCLPLSDLIIAKMLDTERQKVINLRKVAGARLARRLAG